MLDYAIGNHYEFFIHWKHSKIVEDVSDHNTVPSGALGALVLYEIILLLEMSVPFKFSLITLWYSFCEGLNKLSASPLLALSVVILKCPRSNCVALRFGMNLSPPLGVFGAFDPPGVLAWS